MAGIKVEGEATFEGWNWDDPPDSLIEMHEASCRQGAQIMLQIMTEEASSFDLSVTDEGLFVRYYVNLEQFDNLVLVGELELLDPQDYDQDDVEKMIAGLRKAADGLQEALEKEIARKAKPPLSKEELKAMAAKSIMRRFPRNQ